LTTLLEAMSRLQDREEIVFCFIGGGSEFPKVQNYAAERGLRNVRCLPYQPLTSLSGSLSSADLHVVIMGDAFVGIVHPSKIYNIHQVGAPFLYIGPAASSVAEAAPQSSFRHGDVKGVAEFILNAASAQPGGRLTPSISERPEIMDRMLAIVSGREIAIAMKAS
jgi:colanic acid biosynthesis glycosyl transferase WcaI